MKIRALIKHFGLAVVALSVAIACSSTPTVKDTEASVSAAPAAGISSEAEGAIARAKNVRYRVNGLGCKWADTGSLIEEAENQGRAGRNVKAISLANHAEERAVRALEECQKTRAKRGSDAHAH